ncbi:MAG TPA: DNA polymerase III subunit beta [Methylomirabilota bacterium]|jgi:DNA polymerase-3 subunit beta|nr:DNA polymerase III subunit beta [Methylomirabilota bacterium]
MEIQVAREPFLRALQLVQNIVETRQTLPILGNVLIEAQNGGLRVAATDLEVGARVTVPATVARPGAITLAARKLLELVRELPAQPITLKLQDSGWVQLLCGSAAFRLVGLPADEYPPLESGEPDASVSLEGGRLRAMLARTSYAMSQDESRPFLNGLYLVVKKGDFRLVATDGHRLALARATVDATVEMAGIVPRKAVQELGRVLGGSDEATLAVHENQFVLRTAGFVLTSKLIEGTFPSYEQVLPKGHPRRLTVERELLIAALRRVSVVADDRTRPIRLTVGPSTLRLSASSQELGEAEEVLAAEAAGDELTIGFNTRYILDALGPMEGDRVVVELKDALSPGVFRSATDQEHLCVIMPMRI